MDEVYRRLTAPGAPFEMEERMIRGVPTRCYVKALPSLRAAFDLAEAWGNRLYLVFDEDRISYADHARAVKTLAARLAGFGLKKGDRVAIAARNLPEWVVAFWAIVGSGAVAVPLNAWGTGDDLAFAIADSGARIVFADQERLDRLAPFRDALDLAALIALRPAAALPVGIDDFAALVRPPRSWHELPDRAFPDPGLEPEDDATIFYTSGTTGRPKGALGTHRAMATNIVNVGLRTARAALRRGDPLPAPPAGQRITLLPTPLFHVTGTHSGIVPALVAGSRIVLMRKWSVADAFALIERERANVLVTVPTMAWHVVEAMPPAGHDLSSLDTVTYGGAPAAPELERRVTAAFPGILVSNGFGMTETSGVVTSNSAEDMALRPDSVGTIMPACEVRIVDEEGQEVAPGLPGELIVRGPNIIKAYWNRPADTAAALGDGWLRTGDIVRIDQEGFVFALDRAKDMIIRGGENIYSTEVEIALMSHPGIEEAAVVGVPHPVLGEEVGAVICPRPGHDIDDLSVAAHLGPLLAAFKRPAHIAVSSDPLPRNAAGKVLKRALRKMFVTEENPS